MKNLQLTDEDTIEDVLVREVVKQIREDFESGDTTALFTLLYSTSADELIAFLPEKKHEPFKSIIR